jgi:small subunit ribosomal protein S16
VAVRIRLKRLGRAHRAHWRLCATDKRAARDGRVIEELGHYDPLKKNEDKVQIDRERVVHWLKAGAVPSKTVTELLAHLGLDAKGNEMPPRPWKRRKKKGPPPKAAERLAAEEAKPEPEPEAPAEETPPEEAQSAETDADAHDDEDKPSEQGATE